MTFEILATSLSHSSDALLGLLGGLFDEPLRDLWTEKLFEKDRYDQYVMRPLRIGVPLITAVLLIAEWRARKTGEHLSENLKKGIAIFLTALAFGIYYDFGNPNTRYPDYYHRHEFFHYYLGSKYSTELGYHRLYECSAIAEIENGRGAAVRKRELRDLRVNLIRPIEETYVVSEPEECKKHFTPKKWEAFREDVEWFYKSAAGGYWENMWKDHGYNPPPVWTMTGKLFSSFAPAGDTFFKTLATLDVLFQLGSVLLIYWAFGWRATVVATVFWGCNAPANFYWTGGAFLRMDWIFLLVAAMALARKRKFGWAGAALTWSALLRVFPMILFVGWGIIIGLHILRRFRFHWDEVNLLDFKTYIHRDHRRLIGGCVVAAGLLIPASVIATGPNSYAEFLEHTAQVHRTTPLTNHMGLETMLVHTPEGRMRFTRDDNLDDPFAGWKSGRIDRFEARQPVFLAIVAILFLWTVWALRRTKLLWPALGLGLPLTMALTNLTCYYYSMFMVAAGVAIVRPPLAPAMLAVSAASQVLLNKYYFVDDKYTAQSYLFFLFCILILVVYSRPFTLPALKAWWEGKPEPKEGWRAWLPSPAPKSASPGSKKELAKHA